MPIRSPRGRAAAYRALWQWPLRSPARLGVTAVVVLGLAVGISTALGALNPPERAASATPPEPTSSTRDSTPSRMSTPRSAASTALPPVAELTPSALPLSSAPDAAVDVAADWAAAWVRPAEGVTVEQWIEALRPHTTREYLGVLGTVDPGAIPATAVTGPPVPVSVAAGSVEAEVPTDALTLVVLVVLTENDDWRVSGYDRR